MGEALGSEFVGLHNDSGRYMLRQRHGDDQALCKCPNFVLHDRWLICCELATALSGDGMMYHETIAEAAIGGKLIQAVTRLPCMSKSLRKNFCDGTWL